MIFYALLAIGLAITLVVAINSGKSWYRGPFDWEEFWFGILGGAVFTALALGVLALPLSFIAPLTVKPSMTSSETVKLQALDVADSFSGRFFLGSGVISGEAVFSYLVQDPDSGYRLERASADASRIFESDATPEVQIFHWESDPGTFWVPWSTAMKATDTYIFTVPEGSVSYEFEVAP